MDTTTTASDTRMTVCIYRSLGDEGSVPLVYATRLGGRAVEDYLAAVASAPPPENCTNPTGSESEWAVLEIARGGEEPLQHVVHFGCPGIAVNAESLTTSPDVGLTPESVQPWAVRGIPAVLYGPTGGQGAMLESFIGPQG
jgi:hypothetical protein